MEEWSGTWKTILVWNGKFLVWNGRNFAVWNMEKSSSIPCHALIGRLSSLLGRVIPKIQKMASIATWISSQHHG